MLAWLITYASVFVGTGICAYVSVEKSYYEVSHLSQYDNYGDVSMFEHHVPEMAVDLIWHFQTAMSDIKCPARNVTVLLQHGSYPLPVSNQNKTYPGDFFLHRTSFREIQLNTLGNATNQHIIKPTAGRWFGVAYVTKQESNEVIQKITDLDCDYYILINVTTVYLLNFLEISHDTPKEVIFDTLQEYKILRFFTEKNIWRFDVMVTQCSSDTGHDNCSLELMVESGALPIKNSSFIRCDHVPHVPCVLSVISPTVPSWHYLEVLLINVKANVTVTVFMYGCRVQLVDGSRLPSGEVGVSNNTAKTVTGATSVSMTTTTVAPVDMTTNAISQTSPALPSGDKLCGPVNVLYRIEDMNIANYAVYSVGLQSVDEVLVVSPDRVTLIQFDVMPIKDSGGTLSFSALLAAVAFNPNYTQNVTVKMCVSLFRIPANRTQYYCPLESTMEVILDTGDKNNLTATRYIPYPEPGPYFIGVQSYCYVIVNDSMGERVKRYEPCVESYTQVVFEIINGPCVNATCAGHGQCHTYRKGAYIFSSCRCYAKYKGYTCEDDSEADSEQMQLLYTCLLSISNLAFVPAIVVAIYRRYYVEALIYFANMFFSGFYHACDMHPWSIYTLCIMPYHVLSYCDFLLSIISFWVTFVALAEVPPVITSVLHMLGVLTLAMGVEWAQHSLLPYVVPISAGFVLVIIMWVFRCVQLRHCYPNKHSWFYMVPGFILAVVGLVIYAFLQDDNNYPYTHSVWHVTIAISIVFLLPHRRMDSCLGKDLDHSSDEFEFDDRNSIYQIQNDRSQLVTDYTLDHRQLI